MNPIRFFKKHNFFLETVRSDIRSVDPPACYRHPRKGGRTVSPPTKSWRSRPSPQKSCTFSTPCPLRGEPITSSFPFHRHRPPDRGRRRGRDGGTVRQAGGFVCRNSAGIPAGALPFHLFQDPQSRSRMGRRDRERSGLRAGKEKASSGFDFCCFHELAADGLS